MEERKIFCSEKTGPEPHINPKPEHENLFGAVRKEFWGARLKLLMQTRGRRALTRDLGCRVQDLGACREMGATELLAARQVCASDGYSYERADIEMYVTQRKKANKPIVSPMDPDTVSALNTASHVLGYC